MNAFLLFFLLTSLPALAQDFAQYREVTVAELRQINWQKTVREETLEVIVPHQLEFVLIQQRNLSKKWKHPGVVNYLYTVKFHETTELVVQKETDLSLKIKRHAVLSKSDIPTSVGVFYDAKIPAETVFEASQETVTDYTPPVELIHAETNFSLVKDSRSSLFLNRFESFYLRDPIKISRVNRGERTAPFSVLFYIDTEYRQDHHQEILSDLNIENGLPDGESFLKAGLKSVLFDYGVRSVLPGTVDIKYYVTADWSKLLVKVKDKIFTFNNPQKVAAEEQKFHTQLLPEIQFLLLQLKSLKPFLRPDVYQQTYAQIEASLRNLERTIDEQKLSHLSVLVQNQYESIFFLYKNILHHEIRKDANVENYGQLASNICKHLDFCNDNFFQFDPGTPSSAVISMIARHVSLLLEKSKLVVDKYRLPQAESLKKNMSLLFSEAFELSVFEMVGDGDVVLLNQLEHFLALYEEEQAELEKGMKEQTEARILYEQINLGMGFLRKIRE